MTKPRIEVELTENLHSYGFRVFNNGPAGAAGAPRPDIPDRLYYQVDRHRHGLAIVRQIMRDNGGDVVLETGGAGTAFIGTLPRASRDRPARPAEGHGQQ